MDLYKLLYWKTIKWANYYRFLNVEGEAKLTKIKISIITVTFNSEKTLERTIKSIIHQGYDNLEYIVVDGGSTDGTLEIINKYKNHIAKWISEPDTGISNAFNKGIKMATGEIIGIINSDDGLLPNALDTINNAYDETVDAYRGKVLLWKEDTDTKVEEIPSMHLGFGGMDNISHQSTFVTKRAYEKYGNFDETCRYVMDYDLLLRFERKGAKFKYVDSTLAFYSLGGITFSPYTKTRRIETERVMKRNGATDLDILLYRIIKYAKLAVGKVVPKEILMKLKNR